MSIGVLQCDIYTKWLGDRESRRAEQNERAISNVAGKGKHECLTLFIDSHATHSYIIVDL